MRSRRGVVGGVRKIAACQKHGATDPFGWIRHYDWGGAVNITTVYPSKSYTISDPTSNDITVQNDALSLTSEGSAPGGSTDASETTVFYGDRMGYDFRGRQKLWVKPIVYIPEVDAMIPLPHADSDLSRKHTGDLMTDAVDWHERILSTLDTLSTSVNQDITRARLIAVDFSELPFGIEDFYGYLGIRNSDYASDAADRARRFADMPQPTLWNLQLSLKLALLDGYEGNRAGKTYREYQQLAGELLRNPATQLTAVLEQYQLEQRKADDESAGPDLDENQQTLAESIEKITDLDGITENKLTPTGAQRVEQQVQQRLGTQ